MEDQESRRIAAPLARRVGAAADAAQIAAAIFAIWEEVDDALTPVIGSQGVVALFQRSVHLAAASHPWLTAERDSVKPLMQPASLRAAIALQSSTDAAAGGSAFLQTFYELLSSLVGPSLTERLLRAAWTHSSNGTPAQDSTP